MGRARDRGDEEVEIGGHAANSEFRGWFIFPAAPPSKTSHEERPASRRRQKAGSREVRLRSGKWPAFAHVVRGSKTKSSLKEVARPVRRSRFVDQGHGFGHPGSDVYFVDTPT